MTIIDQLKIARAEFNRSVTAEQVAAIKEMEQWHQEIKDNEEKVNTK